MTQLQDLTKDLKEKKIYDMAVTIRKYQDYKVEVAMSKMDQELSAATRKNYFIGGVAYIKEGKRVSGMPVSLCRAIDNVLKECVQPLRPSNSEKRKVYNRKYVRKNTIPPVARLDIVKKPIIAKLSYGVKLEDNIKCFPSYDEANGFLKGLKFMGNTAGKMVSFEGLEEVD